MPVNLVGGPGRRRPAIMDPATTPSPPRRPAHARSPMSRPDSDRNLLFGILALQMDFITRDALVAGMNAWVLEKHRPLGEILVERGALDPRFRALLEPKVAAHIERHGHDPVASLAALSSVGGLASDLRCSVAADPDVLESI